MSTEQVDDFDNCIQKGQVIKRLGIFIGNPNGTWNEIPIEMTLLFDTGSDRTVLYLSQIMDLVNIQDYNDNSPSKLEDASGNIILTQGIIGFAFQYLEVGFDGKQRDEIYLMGNAKIIDDIHIKCGICDSPLQCKCKPEDKKTKMKVQYPKLIIGVDFMKLNRISLYFFSDNVSSVKSGSYFF